MNKPDLNKLPDHSKDLEELYSLANKTYDRLINDYTLGIGIVTPRKLKTYKYIFESYLYKVAELSLEINAIQSDLENYYKHTYKDSPALGNKLFYEEYFDLHKPYDKVKNAIWKGIFKVDKDKIVQPDILR